MPVWMLAVGTLFYGEHPSLRQLLGAALGLVGVATVIGRGSIDTLIHVKWVPGDVYVLVAVIGWAFYSWLLARPPAHMQGGQRPASWDWAGFLLVQTVFGIVTSSLFAGAEQALGAPPIQWSLGVVAALAYVSAGRFGTPIVAGARCG
jgi:drug/metabolite transporter (DMT)-like permease